MLDRKNPYSAIPQLEKKVEEVEAGQKDASLDYSAFREKTEKKLEVIGNDVVDNHAMILEETRRAMAVENTKYDADNPDGFTDDTVADRAESKAESAQTSATAASQAASTAQTAANQAITDAAAASTAAGTAQSSANQALADAATAQAAATTAGQAAATAQAAAEAAVRSTDVLWYAKANTTAPAKPSAAVTTDTDTHGAWTKAVPSWDDSYPYYFACQQFENNTSPATYQWSAVHRDYSITDANTAANAAQADIDGLQDYFWHDSQGAHVLGDTYRTDIKDGLKVVRNSDGSVLADIKADGATFRSETGVEISHLGYGYAKDQSGSVANKYPYASLGARASGYTIGAHSTAEGNAPVASGFCSHSEGYQTEANGQASHAEGAINYANGDSSHAEGSGCVAEGAYSHAEGSETHANGTASHAEGEYTKASSRAQHVQGKHNVEDTDGSYADIVGNGDSLGNESNAYALDWNGNGYYKGDVYVGCNNDSTGGTKLVKTDDSRLTDARTPLAHTHTKSEVTDFSHTHNPADITGLSVADVQQTTVSITISNLAADSATAITNYPAPPPDNSGGWTLLGVCGWYTGNSRITAPLLVGYVSGSNTYCRAVWRNTSSSTITSATASIRMLWVKTV